MPAKSQAQQRFFGMVRAAQKGKLKKPSKAVKAAADTMDPADVKDFAETKHKGLPKKVKKEVVEKVVENAICEFTPPSAGNMLKTAGYVGAGAIAGLAISDISKIIYKIYDSYKTGAMKKCGHLKGHVKERCILLHRLKAHQKQISFLDTQLDKFNKSNAPKSLRAHLFLKKSGIQKKVNNLQQKLGVW